MTTGYKKLETSPRTSAAPSTLRGLKGIRFRLNTCKNSKIYKIASRDLGCMADAGPEWHNT